jgi:hypothetical protein
MCLFLAIAALWLHMPATSAQTPGVDGMCSVTITSPKEGEPVGPDGDVSGTAAIPVDKFLWVFAHRKGLQNWWPQGGGPASVIQGSWHVAVTYGLQRDIGRDFEIAATLVDGEANAKLKAWFERADRTGTYPPVPFPSAAVGCPIVRITVRKSE